MVSPFHDWDPSRPVIYMLKYFPLCFRFCRDIRICKKLCGVINTKESTLVVLKLDSVIDTVESLCLACVQPKVRLGSND